MSTSLRERIAAERAAILFGSDPDSATPADIQAAIENPAPPPTPSDSEEDSDDGDADDGDADSDDEAGGVTHGEADFEKTHKPKKETTGRKKTKTKAKRGGKGPDSTTDAGGAGESKGGEPPSKLKSSRSRSSSSSSSSSRKASEGGMDASHGTDEGSGTESDAETVSTDPNTLDIDAISHVAARLEQTLLLQGSFNLEKRKLFPSEVVSVKDMFTFYNQLRIVTIRRCFLRDNIIDILMKGILRLHVLEELDLSENLLGLTTARRFAEESDELPETLRLLDLRQNQMDAKAGKYLVRTLLDTVDHLNGIPVGGLQDDELEDLDLEEAGLGVPESVILGEALEGNTTLMRLNLSNNGFTSEAMVMILRGLYGNPSITDLILSGNNITNSQRDLQALQMLYYLVGTMASLDVIEIEGIFGPDFDGEHRPEEAEILQLIDDSLRVNRSIARHPVQREFERYLFAQVPRPPIVAWLADKFTPSLTEVDEEFMRGEKVPYRGLQMEGDSFRIYKLEDAERRIRSRADYEYIQEKRAPQRFAEGDVGALFHIK